jgi:DNA-binding NtrC family response regulator
MPLAMQAKLLRVLEEGEVERVGGGRPISVDARVLVATLRNLDELVQSGQFRQDLYHRIYVFPLRLPPLRERLQDIPVLVEHFSRQIAEQNGWKAKAFAPEAIEELQRYRWPGNVRELRNVVERLLLLCDSSVDAAAVGLVLPSAGHAPRGALAERVEAFERDTVLAELERHGYQMTETARALGLERSHLYKKCQQLAIDPKKPGRSL